MAKHAVANPGAVVRALVGGDSVGLNDRELLARFAAGDEDAFAALFRRHAGMVLGVCRRALPCVQDAEDACQAAFLLLSRKAGSGRWQPSVANWLYLTARRVARNARVIAQRRVRRESRVAAPEAVDPVDRMTGRELLAVLDEELDRLPATYREPLVLCYLEGLTRDEAATRLGLPPATVKIRLERGRKRLGDALAKRGCVAGAGLLAVAVASPAKASPLRLVEGALAAASGNASPAVAALARGVALRGLTNKSVAALVVLVGTAALAFGLLAAGPPAAAPPQDAASGQAADAKRSKESKPETPANRPSPRLVTGRVVGPDGKPVAGAKLFVPGPETTGFEAIDDADVRLVGTADANGQFAVTIATAEGNLELQYLVAYSPGFGLDWLQFHGPNDPAWTGEQTLRLPKDLPISGRVVNTEGKPMPGVSVSVSTISVPADEKLDDYLVRWGQYLHDALNSPRKSVALLPAKILGPATTDREGRFTVRGAGTERIVTLIIAGGGVARANPYVVTRPGFDPKPYNEILRKREYDNLRVSNGFLGLHAPEFTFVAGRGKEISGTITDAATGAPVAGCAVAVHAGFRDLVRARTDGRGQYHLTGVPKPAKEFWGSVTPAAESTYLAQAPQFADNEGLTPVRLDVRLAKGAIVTGRVVDKQTGKGLWAGIRFAPLPENEFFGSRPEYRRSAANRNIQESDRDGRFRLVTVPGPALVVAHVAASEMLNGEYLSLYRPATPDPEHRDRFVPNGNSWYVVVAGNAQEFLSYESAAKIIDVKNTGETSVELLADPGVTGKIAVQDTDGQPLAGAWVAGLTGYWPLAYRLPEATATVYALDPTGSRTLSFYHAGKRLGGLATVRANVKEPVVVKLKPLARVTGRLLDVEGQALTGAEVSLFPAREIDRELYRFAVRDGGRAITDKDGRFSLGAVVPGVWFDLQIRKNQRFYRTAPKIDQRSLRPGETIDLGDRPIAP